MKHIRMKIMGIVLLMLLLSVPTVYCQQENKTAEIINYLEQMRPEMLEKLAATIPVKEQFAQDKTDATSSCNKEEVPNACTYKYESGEVLSEIVDASGYLVTDSFEDDANNIRIDTEYSINNRQMCYTFMDTLLQLSLKVCYPCSNNTTSTVWQNQTLMNYTTGDTMTWTLDCDENITKRIFTLGPGAPLVAAAPAPAPVAAAVGTPGIPSTTTCRNTLQTEIRAPLPG